MGMTKKLGSRVWTLGFRLLPLLHVCHTFLITPEMDWERILSEANSSTLEFGPGYFSGSCNIVLPEGFTDLLIRGAGTEKVDTGYPNTSEVSGTVIDCQGRGRHLNILHSKVTLTSLTLVGGRTFPKADGSSGGIDGGCVRCGPGCMLTLESVTFHNCTSAGYGGALSFTAGSGHDTYGYATDVNISDSVSGSVGGCVSLWYIIQFVGRGVRLHRCESGAGGGGLGSVGSIMTFESSSSIHDCVSHSQGGGGLYAWWTEATIRNDVSISRNRDGGADGGGLHISGDSDVWFSDHVEISENTAGIDDGGGMFVVQSRVFASNMVTFDNNWAWSSGGAVYAKTDSVLDFRHNVSFNGNTAYGDGGAILILSGCSLTMAAETRVTSCWSNYHGGAIYAYGGRVRLHNGVVISGNWARRYGGGIYIVSSEEGLEIYDNVLIADNIVNTFDGGGIFAFECPVHIHNLVIISGNYARSQGGGVCLNKAPAHMFESVSINDNVCDGPGGGIFVTEGDLYLYDHVAVIRNLAATLGGGIRTMSSTSSISNSSQIRDNLSGSHGGGLSMYFATASISSDIEVSSNEALMDGGGIHLQWECILTMRDSITLNDNSAGASGGALAVFQGTLTMVNGVSITKNQAEFHGAIYVAKTYQQRGTMFAEGSILIAHNHVQGSGGALCVQTGFLVILGSDVVMKGNSAKVEGGAVWSHGGIIQVDGHVEISDSHSGSIGGGLYLEEHSELVATAGLILQGNQAVKSGGGMASLDSEVTGSAVVFLRNSAVEGGGLYVGEGANVSLVASSWDGNSASVGGAVLIDVGQVMVTASKFSGNRATQTGGSVHISYSGVLRIGDSQICNASAVQGGNFFVGGRMLAQHCTISTGSSMEGGAVFASAAASVEVIESNVKSHSAASNGGSFYLSGDSKFLLQSSEVTDSIANDFGGGIYFGQNPQLRVANSSFLRCSAASGGAIMAVGGSLTLSGPASKFSDCRALTFDGGALWISTQVAIADGDTTIDECSAKFGRGGGVFLGDSSVLVVHPSSNMILTSNSAAHGGGVAIKQSGRIVLSGDRRIKLLNNHGFRTGGALALLCDQSMESSGCQITDSQVPDGIANRSFRALDIRDNTCDWAGGAVHSSCMLRQCLGNVQSPDFMPKGLEGWIDALGISGDENQALAYGDVFATAPRKIDIKSVGGKVIIPGQSHLAVSVQLLDAANQTIRSSALVTNPYTAMILVCSADSEPPDCTTTTSFQGPMPFVWETGSSSWLDTSFYSKTFAFCEVGRSEVLIVVEVQTESSLLRAGHHSMCEGCRAGQTVVFNSQKGKELWHCATCQDGKYSVDPQHPCQLCPQGASCSDGLFQPRMEGTDWKFSSVTGLMHLVSCPKGHRVVNQSDGVFNHVGQTCQLCAAGSKCLRRSCQSCDLCPPGTYKVLQALECSPCPPNTFSVTPGLMSMSECERCPENSDTRGISGGTGPHSCVCFDSHYMVMEGTERVCRRCPAGARCADGRCSLAEGIKCSGVDTLLGRWHRRENESFVLTECPRGTLIVNQPHDDQICHACKPLTYSINPFDGCRNTSSEVFCSQRDCLDCPLGAFCDGTSFVPTVDSEWEVQESEGDLRYRLTSCQPGHVVVRNYSKNSWAQDECLQCPSGKYSIETAVFRGHLHVHKAELARDQCRDCENGATCAGGQQVLPKAGYWRTPGNGRRSDSEGGGSIQSRVLIYRCRKHGCLEGGICAEGHHGVVCGQCKTGWALADSKCQYCGPRTVYQKVAFTLLTLALLAVWYVVAWRPLVVWKDKDEKDEDLALSANRANHSNRSFLWKLNFRIRVQFASLRSKHVADYAKIFISYWQVTSSFESNYLVQYPWELNVLWAIHSVTKLDLSKLPGFHCLSDSLDFTTKLQITISAPLLSILLLSFPTLLLKFTGKRRTQRYADMYVRFWRNFLFVLFITFPIASSVVLESLHCRTIDGRSLLVADIGQECPSLHPWSAAFVFGVLGIIIYPIGCPIFMLYALYEAGVPAMAREKFRNALLNEVMAHYNKTSRGRVCNRLATFLLVATRKRSVTDAEQEIRKLFDGASKGSEVVTADDLLVYLSELHLVGSHPEELRTLVTSFDEAGFGALKWEQFNALIHTIMDSEDMFPHYETLESLHQEQLLMLLQFDLKKEASFDEERQGTKQGRTYISGNSFSARQLDIPQMLKSTNSVTYRAVILGQARGLARLVVEDEESRHDLGSPIIGRGQEQLNNGDEDVPEVVVSTGSQTLSALKVKHSSSHFLSFKFGEKESSSFGSSKEVEYGSGGRSPNSLVSKARIHPGSTLPQDESSSARSGLAASSIANPRSTSYLAKQWEQNRKPRKLLEAEVIARGQQMVEQGFINTPSIRWDHGVPKEEEILKKLGFLIDTYKPEFWYWEVVDMSRKLTLTSLVVFLWPGSTDQIAAAFIVTAVAMLVYSKAQPLADLNVNNMNSLSLTAQAATTFYTLMLAVWIASSQDFDTVGPLILRAIVVLLNILVLNLNLGSKPPEPSNISLNMAPHSCILL